ncbi:hypothetical protein BDR26DRAFT_938134 [Obelidium mucronatum]|nr:hypothetical protein BDR26DRAFT_938134 [Obelidium mucronatum]
MSKSPFSATLLAPPNSCRTSLLFQAAFEAASHPLTSVLVIARRKWTRKPMLTCVLDPARGSSFVEKSPGEDVLKRIIIKYANSHSSLRKLIASLPTTDSILGTPVLPSCILIDDFSSFFDPALDSLENIRFTLALLSQTVAFIRSVTLDLTHPSAQCFFLIIDLSPRFLSCFNSIHLDPSPPPSISNSKRKKQQFISVPLEQVYQQSTQVIFNLERETQSFYMNSEITPFGMYHQQSLKHDGGDDGMCVGEKQQLPSIQDEMAKILWGDHRAPIQSFRIVKAAAAVATLSSIESHQNCYVDAMHFERA